MSVPMYMEIPAECAADALLERDGALRPLALSFDPRDVRASASADRPGEAEARAVEAVARAARAIVAAIEPIVAALDAVAAVQPIVDVVSPVVEAVSAVTATPPRSMAKTDRRRCRVRHAGRARKPATDPPPFAENLCRLDPFAAETAPLWFDGLGARRRADLRPDADTLRRKGPESSRTFPLRAPAASAISPPATPGTRHRTGPVVGGGRQGKHCPNLRGRGRFERGRRHLAKRFPSSPTEMPK